MEQTLVRIYQREFCPGFPPQFAWPRLDGGGEGDEPSTSNRRRRPRARGQQQAEQQRVYAEVCTCMRMMIHFKYTWSKSHAIPSIH